MKVIGFDGKRAVMNYTGIGNYSRLALESILPLLGNDVSLRLYTPKMRENPRLEQLLKSDRVEIKTPDTLSGKIMPHIWRSRGLSDQLKREKPILYHGLSNELPAGIRNTGIPSVVTIHDLIFLRHPEFYHDADVEICNRKFRYAAENADRIIAISKRTADDLRELYNIPEEKIRIVYQGCSPIFSQTIDTKTIKDLQALYGRYIIGVGTIEKRKNQLLAVKALAKLPEDINLVLVGRPTAYAKEIMKEAGRLGLTDRIFMLQNVPMTEIPALYAAAVFSSYPSFYEGFGIPMLEALAAGTPVIAATGSCLEEAGGPGAVYIDPTDADSYASAAKELIDNPILREEMVARGRQYIKRFAPENFGQGLVNVYNELI